MIELNVSLRFADDDVRPVGTLANDRGRTWFAWDAGFARSGTELSPYSLPVSADPLLEHTYKPGVPIPGVFNDARPDGWGLKLLHRAFQAQGRPASSVSPLEELAFLGSNTMGALCFEPATGPGGALDEAIDLARLAAHAQDVFDDRVEVVLPELLRTGGSPGGARPKALIALREEGGPGVRHGEGTVPPGWVAWLVKFPARNEDVDVGRREFAWMRLAEAAGISVPETHILEVPGVGACFAARRFDRSSSGRRRHMLSAAGALDADFRTALVDYGALLRLCALICEGDQAQVLALFRLAVFNVAAANRDDHLKNFAWILDRDIGWRLAPGYDLTFSPGNRGRHTTTVNGIDRHIARPDLIALAEGAGLARHAERVIDEVLEGVARCDELLAESGCGDPVSRQAASDVRASAARLTR